MLQRLLLAFLGLFVAHTVAQVPTPMPSLYPLPAVTYSTSGTTTGAASYQPVMKFGTIALPPVNISFANTDYTAHYILTRALSCGLGITTSPIRFVESANTPNSLTMSVQYLNASAWTTASTPLITAGCSTPRPSVSSTPTMTVRVVMMPSLTPTMTPRIVEKPSESASMTPKVQEPTKPPGDVIMPPERPSESSSATPNVQEPTVAPADVIMPPERPSESSSATPNVQEPTVAPADVVVPPDQLPSETPTMTPRILEKPSETPTMTARAIQKPSESSTITPTMTIRVVERPSESATMTPKMVERPSETSTMTARVIQKPSESSTMTPKMVERPSETSTMTPKMVERPSETSTMTPKMVERPSESATMTARVIQKPSESSTLTPTMTIRVVERPSETSTMTPKMVERPSESATVASIVFDQRISQSVSATPTSSRTPLQSYYAQYINSNKPTPTPTRSITPSRTTYPHFSTRPTAPSRTKAPTRYPVASPYIQLVPTRVAIKSKTPIAIPSGYLKPAVIGSSVTLPGANTTAVTQPAQLQQLQAALACALGTPLENIQITNITYVDSTGKPNTVAFDASVAQLNSNGSVVCYTSGTTATPAPTLRGRRLQITSNDQVVIEYAILDPPAEILFSDPNTFVDTVTNTAAIQDYAAAINSNAVTVDVPIELLSYAAVANAPTGPEAPTPSAALNGSTIAGITLCVVGVIGIAGAIMVVRKRKAGQQKIITRTVNVVEMNPVARNMTLSESSRAVYVPNQVR